MLVLVPALQEDPLGLPFGLDEPDHLGVVGGRELQVGDPDLDVREAEDAHLRVHSVRGHVCTFMNRSLRSPS